jgi:HrpA-like RNA helicase
MFPVQVYYEKEEPRIEDYPMAAAKKVKQIMNSGSQGDILIFMPGKKEINQTVESILNEIGYSGIEILQLHSELSPEEQNKIFLPSQKRKIIVSNITIDGIIHVIDSGLVKQNQFDPRTGIEQLVLVEHALSGINQRAGRAGRTAPGFCHRLYTERSLSRRQEYQTSEIQRSNLSQVILAMKKVGI